MSDLAILVLESPWEEPTNGSRRQTARPFFEGLEKIHPTLAVYYATFYDASSLRAALDDLLQAREARQVIYIGSHGSPGRVGDIRQDVFRRLLLDRKDSLKRVEGLIVSACDVFSSKEGELLNLLTQTGFRWAVGYSCTIGWFNSTLIELAILNALAEQPDTAYRRSQGKLADLYREALSLFNHAHPLEWSGLGTVAEHLVIGLKSRANSEPQLLPLGQT